LRPANTSTGRQPSKKRSVFGAGLEAVQFDALGRFQRIDKGLVRFLGEGTVDVIPFARSAVPVIATLPPGRRHGDAFPRDNGGQGIIEIEVGLPHQVADPLRQGAGGQRAGSDDRGAGGDLGDFLAAHGDGGGAADGCGDSFGEDIAIHGQRPTGRQGALVGAADDQAAQAAHLLFEQAQRPIHPRRSQAVAANQLSKLSGRVGLGGSPRPHLEQIDCQTALCSLPGSLRTGQTRTDNR